MFTSRAKMLLSLMLLATPGGCGDVDMEGEACGKRGKSRECGEGQVQTCGARTNERLHWGSCEAEAPEYQPDVTPLVLRFDQERVEFRSAAGETSFSIEQDVTCDHDWPTANNPWLVRDLNGNGRVDDGTELFGSGTRLSSGELAEHGFQALAELDTNNDGVLDGEDPGFHQLQLWWDHDGDRDTDRRELSPLTAMGIQAFSLDYRVQVECDARGNCGRERAPMLFAPSAEDVGLGEVVDVYLACQ